MDSGNSHGPSSIWRTKAGRHILIILVGVVVVALTVGFATVMFHSLTGESRSYRDGFSAGGDVYTSDSVLQADAQQACRTAERGGPGAGGPPSGDNSAQWLKGCIDAFNEAQSGN